MGPNGEKIIAFIPARGGSKSIPLKNIKLLCGRPLIYYVLDAATGCKYIDEIYVSTDSERIKQCIIKYEDITKIKIVERSPETATDEASTESVMLDFVKRYSDVSFDVFVLIQATSPLLESLHLNEGIEKIFLTKSDSLVSVCRQKRFIWTEKDGFIEPFNYDPYNRPRRQDFKGFLVENGAFYITFRDRLIKTGCRISGKITYYEMPEETYIELDEPIDWVIVENILRYKKKMLDNKLIEKIKKVRLLALDCDGVLTDGGMYYSKDGETLKKFNTIDGMGIATLREKGIKVAIVTGEESEIVVKRAIKLGIDEVFTGVKDKLKVIELLSKKYNLKFSEIGYMGDDINDIEVLKKVGFSIAPRNAVEEVKDVVDYITQRKAGYGAVREACDLIIDRTYVKV